MTYTETVECSECGYRKKVVVNTNDCCCLDDILEDAGWYQKRDGTWVCGKCYNALVEE